MMRYLFLILCLINISCKNKVNNNGPIATKEQLPLSTCEDTDGLPPSMQGELIVVDDGSINSTPSVSWSKANDNCKLSHYELAIGTTPAQPDLQDYTNIGNVTNYSQKDLSLSYLKDYYYFVRAIDGRGNQSTPIVSNAWKIFTPKSLTNLILWLDSSRLTFIEDENGNTPNSDLFSGSVKKWNDQSGSINAHNLLAAGVSPNWDPQEKAISFNGSDQMLSTPNHNEINLKTVSQRSITIAFKTGAEIDLRQVLYEEGGQDRGINFYIENGQLRCGFWNIRDDGDGAQPYQNISATVSTHTTYIATLVFDYSSYNGKEGVNGNIDCYLNQMHSGSIETTSRLHPHSGEIGIAAVKYRSRFPEGANNTHNLYYFKGLLYEFLIYNNAHSFEQVIKLQDNLMKKWNM